ncbi:hypothetical protein, partial [Treponema endosymbiont of Eucomonympha sp.]|uniref:hypothetical protein n=1 Tax=Treponema endosymbiont of Eucomonympha sp. TaxID=1580831 RepID=UPI001396C4AC
MEKCRSAGTARRTGAKEGVCNVYEISRRGSAADFLRIGSLKADGGIKAKILCSYLCRERERAFRLDYIR